MFWVDCKTAFAIDRCFGVDGSDVRSFALPVELVDVTLLRLALGSVFGVMGFLGRAVERFIVTTFDDSLSCFGVDGSLERPTGFV